MTKEAIIRGRSVALWTLTWVLTALFLMAGSAKLAGAEPLAQSYSSWGLPAALLAVVGGAEVLGALLLLFRRVASFGASVLAAVMVGALGVHLGHGETGAAVLPAVLLGLLTIVGWARRCATLELLRPALPGLPRAACPGS